MRTLFSGAALTVLALDIALGLAAAGCTHTDEEAQAASRGGARPQLVTAPATSLHPPVQKDAADGQVHEYY